MSLWIERERYSGATAALIDSLIGACEAEGGPNHLGVKVLIAVMCWLSIPLEKRNEYWDSRTHRAQFGKSSVEEPEDCVRLDAQQPQEGHVEIRVGDFASKL